MSTVDVTDVQINELAYESGCHQDEMMVALCDLAVGRPLLPRRRPDALIETLRSRGYLLQEGNFVCDEDRALAREACVRVIRFAEAVCGAQS